MVRRLALALAAVLVCALTAAPAGARPFGYLPTPTDQLGVPGSPAGTEITPPGSLYTGSVELGFRFGPRLAP